MTNHTDTSRSGDLVKRLREDGYSGHNPLCLEAADRIETLEAQIDRLASFIMHCIEGEPSQSQGAVDTAIRIMTEQATTIGEQLTENERLRLDVEAQEALQVSAYHAGLRAGWNFGVSDDNASMQAAMANTDHIKELRRIREARAALAGDSHDQ